MNMRSLVYVCGMTLLLTACKSVEKVIKTTVVERVVDYGSPRVEQRLVNDQVFHIGEYSTDKTYGYTEENPIMVGGGMEGPKNQVRFLNALAGPQGEQVSYRRLGSCCPFRTKNGMLGDSGMLDRYEITYESLRTPIVLYLNMYDSDVLKAPVGFTLRQL